MYFEINKNYRLFVTTYVDDLLLACDNDNILTKFKNILQNKFEMTDIGPLKYILGIQISQSINGIKLYQEQCIEKLLKKFKFEDCKGSKIPMEVEIQLHSAQPNDIVTNAPYASLIGSLLYISNCTRPDITYAVHRLSSFNAYPTENHWKAAKRVLRYLKETKHQGLFYKRNDISSFHGYCDTDWANDPDSRRSVSGCIFSMIFIYI